MHKIWLVLTNASMLKIYEAKRDTKIQLALIEERYHPESRLKESELVSDGPGKYQAMSGRGAYEAKTSAKNVEADHFAREILKVIQEGLKEQQFQSLIVVASPHFEGLLKQVFPKSLNEHIKHFITKDYTEKTIKEIEELLGDVYRPLLGIL